MQQLMKTLLLVLALAVPGAAFADLQRGLRNYQEIISGRKKVEQLSPEEIREVLEVHKAADRQRGARSGGTSRPSYEIEVSHNDELFVINGEKFEAKTYCFNMEEGDRVIFLDGSPLGACASATLLNLRTRDKCEVWCE